MFLEVMGLFMVGIPGAGFALGVLLLFVRRLRFLAAFSFLIPLFSSYGALAGFWEVGCAFEGLGLGETVNEVAAVVAGMAGATLGAALGAVSGAGVIGLVRRLRGRGGRDGSCLPPEQVSPWLWWGSRRRRYSIALLAAGLLAAGCYVMISWGGDRLLGPAPLRRSLLSGAVSAFAVYLFAVGLANVWYLAGPFSENIVRPANLNRYRRITLGLGYGFSLLLFFAYPAVLAAVTLLCAVTGQ